MNINNYCYYLGFAERHLQGVDHFSEVCEALLEWDKYRCRAEYKVPQAKDVRMVQASQANDFPDTGDECVFWRNP